MALVDLSSFDNIKPVSLRDISLRQGISLDYLEQIFFKLKKHQIVKSIRGTQGGYILSKKPNEIKLTNIFYAVDEKVKTVQCKKDSKKGCNGKATKCITHNLWDELEIHINSFFEKKSLEDLVKNNKEQRI
jgi:Rrf2 family iron-sulfur cluster assembly transcriptional regulator